jgi:radical SAM protein with 4Fe4S-binding SPASM domain
MLYFGVHFRDNKTEAFKIMTQGVKLPHLHKYFPILQLIRSNYFSKGPTSVDIELSNRCNLRCEKCWFHGENGIGDRYRNSEMTTTEILELINQLAAYKPHIYFGGGEPLIREDFLKIVAHVKSFSLPISFTTNGTLLDKNKIEMIAGLGIEKINFSIDGLEELHDKLRGKGNFRKVMSNMQYLIDCKKKKSLKKPSIIINLTISPLIISHLKDTIDTIREKTGDEIDFFRIHHLWFVTPRELQNHKKEVHKALDSSAHGAGAHCIPLSRCHDTAALSNEIHQLKGKEKIIFFPPLQDQEILNFYSEDYRLTKRCMAPFRAVLVKPNGDIKFCPDEWIDGYVLGNIRDDRFETIWNNKRAKHFRSVIFRKKSFPGCKRCSWMYCF